MDIVIKEAPVLDENKTHKEYSSGQTFIKETTIQDGEADD